MPLPHMVANVSIYRFRNGASIHFCPLGNVVRRELEGRSNDDLGGVHANALVLFNDLIGAAIASGIGLAHRAGGGAVDEGLDGISRASAHINGIPQIHIRAGQAFANIAVHLGGQAETRNFDGAAAVLHSLGASQDTHGGGAADDLQVGIVGHEGFGLVIGLLGLVVAIYGDHPLQVLILGVARNDLLHGRDPGILVGGGGGGGQYGKLAFAAGVSVKPKGVWNTPTTHERIRL